jgi:hypothetical protein
MDSNPDVIKKLDGEKIDPSTMAENKTKTG